MGTGIDGRVAVITGGAGGIGAATARAFAAAGARVAIWDMAEAPGQALADELGRADGRALFLRVNVADRQAVEAAATATVAALGPISILINNAGITRDAQLVRVKDGAVVGGMSEADFDAVLAVNLKGVY
ncbi:MAG TPA: SDR family NAD(P)-dependent oxidoreductase, partial [Chloroflexia bacterium]|nr:SDR family NAD(P)-dependent oxidoreductase [Chloroflexia bacterium]